MTTDEEQKALERQARRLERIDEARATLVELLDEKKGVSTFADDRWQMAFFKYAFFSLGFLFAEVDRLQLRQEGLSDGHQDLSRRMEKFKEDIFADNTRIVWALKAWEEARDDDIGESGKE